MARPRKHQDNTAGEEPDSENVVPIKRGRGAAKVEAAAEAARQAEALAAAEKADAEFEAAGSTVDSPPAAAKPEDEAIPDTLGMHFSPETLAGDARDFVLNRLRYHQDKRPWDEQSEAQQRDTIAECERWARQMVTRAIEIVSVGERPMIRGVLSSIMVKDGMKCVVEVSKMAEKRHALVDAQGAGVWLLVIDPSEFEGEKAPVPVKPDQSPLAL